MKNIAAIDVGSNAVRLALASVMEGGVPQVFFSAREAIRLGTEAFHDGTVQSGTVRKLCEAFVEFAGHMQRYGVTKYRAVGTSALRDATNSAEIVAAVRQASGIELEIIDGQEEGRLVYTAVAATVPDIEGISAMMDIGGGSLEVAVFDREGIHGLESLDVGTVRLLDLFEVSDANEHNTLKKLNKYLATAAQQARKELRLKNISRLIGTGGNVEELLALRKRLVHDREEPTLQRRELESIYDALTARNTAGRRQELGLRSDRADVIVPAAATLRQFMDATKIDSLLVAGVGLKDGILYDLARDVQGVQFERRRSQTLAHARSLAQKFEVDIAEAKAVAALATSLFDVMAGQHGLDREARLMLEVAALLQDCGRYIDPHSHHKHSAYVIRSAPIVGLTPRQRELAATVARYHRKSTPKARHPEFAGLTPADQQLILQLAALLRSANAVVACGSVQGYNLLLNDQRLDVRIRCGGDPEMSLWATANQSKFFAKTFQRELTCSVDHA